MSFENTWPKTLVFRGKRLGGSAPSYLWYHQLPEGQSGEQVRAIGYPVISVVPVSYLEEAVQVLSAAVDALDVAVDEIDATGPEAEIPAGVRRLKALTKISEATATVRAHLKKLDLV